MRKRILSTFLILVCLSCIFASLCSVSAVDPDGTIDANANKVTIGSSDALGGFKFNLTGDKKGDNSTTAKITLNENPLDNDNAEKSWQKIYDKYRTLINFAYGAMMLTCLAGLVISVISLGASGGNPHKKQQAMTGILFTGLGIALLGSVGTWFIFAMNIL